MGYLRHPTSDLLIFRKKNEKGKSHGYIREVVGNLEDYLDKCTLHGLKYVGDATLSFGER